MSDRQVINLARATLTDRNAEKKWSKGALLEMIRHLVVHLITSVFIDLRVSPKEPRDVEGE